MSASEAGTGGLREHKKRATRTAIHDAALSLVSDRGIDGVTVEEICERAEVSQRTFFNYYPSKAAAVLGMSIHTIGAPDRRRFLAGRGGLLGDLCDMVGAHVEALPDSAGLKRLASCQPGLLGDVGRRMDELRGDLTGLASQRTGNPRTARMAVSLVISALGFTLQSADAPEGRRALSTTLRHVVQEMGDLARSQQ